MSQKLLIRVLSFITLLFCVSTASAQLLVDPNTTPEEVAQLLVGDGVVIDNAQVTAADSSWGYYNSTGTEIGTSEGLLLTTGKAVNAIGPNDESGLPDLNGSNCLNCDEYDNDFPGSQLLNDAQDRTTFDATTFEFDVFPQGDSLKFDFTFASEEYNEWVDSPFNDVFGFYISGPNIGTDVNIALIPGTSTAVAINSVNNNTNSQYFYDNTNPAGSGIQYDGFTVDLQAVVGNLIPCEEYHLKLIIGDGSDRLYDSAVFVEKIESNPVTILTASAGGTDTMIEGCNDGTVTFIRDVATPSPQEVTFYVGGTATDGIDYTPQIGTGNENDPITITIPANQTTFTIDLEAIADGLIEGTEYITFFLENPLCAGGILDSTNLYIADELEVDILPGEATICAGECVEITGVTLDDGDATFSWSPLSGIQDPNSLVTDVCPDSTTVYTLTSEISDCEAQDSIRVNVTSLDILLTPSPVSCEDGSTGSITTTVGNGNGPYTFDWTGPDGYTSNDQNPDDLATGTYCVTVTDSDGCTTEACVDVVEGNLLEVESIDIADNGCEDISCNGGSDGEITLTVVGGVGAYTIEWDTNPVQTGPTATGLSAGTYTATITDEVGCTITSTTTLEEPDPLVVDLVGQIDVLCNGDQNGVATLTATGGCTPYFYNWSHDPDLASPVATNLPSGTFYATVTDNNGCTSADSVEIVVGQPGDPISVTYDNISSYHSGAYNVSCADASDGFIDITIDGGTPGYTIQWEEEGSGDTYFTEDISNLPCGTYILTVTDDNDCVFTDEVELTCPPAINLTFTTVPNPCTDPEAGIGEIDITVTGGVPPLDIDWTGPDGFMSTDEDITNLNSGIYTVTVTDDLGCTYEETINLTTNDDIAITANTITDVTCFGDCTGSIDVTITGGTGDYTLEWTGPDGFTADTEDIADLCPGNYLLSVTDEAGCQEINQFSIEAENDEIEIDFVDIETPSCFGQNDGSVTANVSGGTGDLTLEWLEDTDIFFPGSNQPTINNLFEGTYVIEVTDDISGCVLQDSIFIEAPQVLDLNIEVTEFDGEFNISCNGENDGQISVTVTGGEPSYTYDWSGCDDIAPNDPNSGILTGLPAGIYCVDVTDTNGCLATTTITLSEPNPISATAVIDSVSCNGNCDGVIDATPTGGSGSYTNFNWLGTNEVGLLLDSLCAGEYTLEITDSNNCLGDTTFTVDEAEEIQITVDAVQNVSCFGESDGSISVSAIGGTDPLDYSWVGPDNTSYSGSTIGGLPAGTYTLTVTDESGCTTQIDVEVEEPEPFTVDLTVPTGIEDPIFEIPCVGDTVSIDTGISGGTPPYTGEWTVDGFPDPTFDPNVVRPGEYCYTVTDSEGCEASGCITVTEPDEALEVTSVVSLFPSGDNISCFGACDGAIDLTVTGGVDPYSFVWRDELDNEIAFTEDVTDLCVGDYEVLVTDDNGCDTTLLFTLTEPDQLVVNTVLSDYNGFNISCNGLSDGSLEVSVEGGSPGYEISWIDTVTTNLILTDIPGGTYTLSVVDTNGCELIQPIEVVEPDPITFDPTINNISCDGETNGSIEANPIGGTGDYVNITWDNGAVDTTFISDLTEGEYCIDLEDTNGCPADTCFSIIEPDQLLLDFDSEDATCGQANGSIDLITEGGTEPFDFDWTGPNGFTADTEDLTDILAGTYNVVVSDAAGCIQSLEITIDGPPTVIVDASITDVECGNDTDGAISIIVENTIGDPSITWTDSEGNDVGNGTEITGLSFGDYTATIEDTNGCVYDFTFSVDGSSPVVADFDVSLFENGHNISTLGGNDGFINTELSGGTPPYDISWTGPDGFTSDQLDIDELFAGQYTLTVTDANGCVYEFVIDLTEPSDLTLPNGFTPNGDGFNDFFVILGLERYPENNLKVFNRWGNLVYEKENYDNTWAGGNTDGEELPEGTYFAVFTTPDGTELNTYVDLRR
jgi:gliding motility-associated-like protein